MPSIVTLILVSAALAAGLIFMPISSYASSYIAMGAALVGAVMFRQRLGPILRHPAYLAVFAAMGLLVVTLPFVWQGPGDLLLLVAILPVPIGFGLVALIEVEPRFGSPLLIGSFSLIATIVALLAGLEDVYVHGLERAGSGNNPIHFADLTVTLGFFSLVGLFGTQKLWRVVFLAGPVLGLEVVLLSQTRGAVIGFVLVLALALLLLAIWYRHVWRFLAAGAVVLALAITALVYTTPVVSNRALSAFSDAEFAYSILMSDKGVDAPIEGIDFSTDQRIALVRGAWGVFSSHPVFGVGAGQIIEAAREYFPNATRIWAITCIPIRAILPPQREASALWPICFFFWHPFSSRPAITGPTRAGRC